MNSIRILRPYRWQGMWVFDAPEFGLCHEPFVCGADDIISEVVRRKAIRNADRGFLLLFSDRQFPTAHLQLDLLGEEGDGHVYVWSGSGMAGWLCPALLKYFPQAPERIFAQFKSIGDSDGSD